MQKILIFDNYDSFTYNLVHLVAKFPNVSVDVFRNDAIAIEAVAAYDKIILSPGPGIPSEAGMLLDLIKNYAPIKPILGVCLGHQAIGQSFGGKLVNLSSVFHGVATPIHIHTDSNSRRSYLFDELSDQITVGRYHSWVVDDQHLPDCLTITARDAAGFIMGLQHNSFDIQGVQFHPESVLTPDGEKIINNWLKK
jgi:anthranilate synthase component 2